MGEAVRTEGRLEEGSVSSLCLVAMARYRTDASLTEEEFILASSSS